MAKLSTIEKFRKIVFDSTIKNKPASLHNLKDGYPISEIKKVIPHIESHPVAKRYLYGAPFPKTYKDLRKCFYTYQTDFEKELDWLCLSLNKFHRELNSFIKEKRLFEKYLLLGEYDLAFEQLQKINREICVSLWSIENGLLLEELSGGLKKNKELLSELNKKEIEILSSLFADFYSNKAERQLSSIRYNSILEEFVRDFDKGFQEYWSIKLNFLNTNVFKEFSDILIFDSKSSIIDRYLTFIRLCQWISLNGNQEDKVIIRSRIGFVDTKIDDPLLNNLKCLFDVISSSKVTDTDERFVQILDDYTIGNYTDAEKEAEVLLTQFPFDLSLYEIYVKCLFRLKKELPVISSKKNLVNEILEDLVNIYAKNDSTGASVARLTKTSIMLDSFAISPQIYTFLQGLVPDKSDSEFKQPLYLNSFFRNPWFFRQYENYRHQQSYIENIGCQFPNSVCVKFLASYLDDVNPNSLLQNIAIPDERVKFYEAKATIRRQDYIRAIDILEELKIGQDNPIFKEDILVNLFLAYRESSDFDSCIRLYVENYVANNNNILRFELGDIAKRIEREKFKNVKPDIYLPIFFFITKQDNHSTNVALRVFLRSMGMKRPPELVEHSEMFDKELLVELLYDVCIPEVMKYSTYFSGTKDILSERLEIFQLLTQVNPEASKKYKQEISRLSQQLAIIEGVREVDESKIYVDEKGLINNEFLEIQNNFNRYIEISNMIEEKPYFFVDIFSNKTILFKALDINISEEDAEKARLSKDIKFSLFKELFHEILDRFLFSNQYGLDSYLSTRIRHGTLLGQFRSEFQKQHLITQKDKATDEYHSNNHWMSRLDIGESEMELVQGLLANFSSKIDQIANNLKENHIQIRTAIKGTKGLLDYKFKEVELAFYFAKFFKKVNTYEHFVTYALALIWEKTETNLEIIQKIISINIKQEIIDNLIELEKDLKEIVPEASQIQELVNNIANCRTNIISQIERIADWFKKRENITSDFKVDKVLDTSIEITKKISQINLINVTSSIDSLTQFRGEFFIHFFDLIRIFLENAVSYSKLSPEDLQLEISATENDNELQIVIVNNLADDFNVPTLIEIFTDRKAILDSQDWNMELLKTEKGTGFYKAKKILTTNLQNPENNFSFKVEDDKKVRVVINIDLAKVRV